MYGSLYLGVVHSKVLVSYTLAPVSAIERFLIGARSFFSGRGTTWSELSISVAAALTPDRCSACFTVVSVAASETANVGEEQLGRSCLSVWRQL